MTPPSTFDPAPDRIEEHGLDAALDDLHTRRPALAGAASRTAGRRAAVSGLSHRRLGAALRRHSRRLVVATVVMAVAGAGGAAAAIGDLRGTVGAGRLQGVAGSVVASAARPNAATTVEPNGVAAYGGAPDLGPDTPLPAALAGIAATTSGDGYWVLARDGGVFGFGDAAYHGSAWGAARTPAMGIAATPSGDGYWIVMADGGVFGFGDAAYHGSAWGAARSPVTGIAATPSGDGYWLVASDGGVFAFGDAAYHGGAAGRQLAAGVIGVAATRSGEGYWLLAADGGVFAFGDAEYEGSSGIAAGAVGIAADRDGEGYRVVAADGTVRAYGAAFEGPHAPGPETAPTVGIASARGRGYWTLQAYRAPTPTAPAVDPNHPFLACTRRYESDTSGGYAAVNPSGRYRGAYQFSQATWNYTAAHAGRHDLIGVDPATARPADQDFLALHLYHWEGARHWNGRCAGL